MSLVFTLRPEYEGLTGGTTVYGDGRTFDVVGALADGNGKIVVDDQVLASALRSYSGPNGPVLESVDSDEAPNVVVTPEPAPNAPVQPNLDDLADAVQTQHGDEISASAYAGLNSTELREEARNRGLSTDGNKKDLVARLDAHDEQTSTSTEADR